MDSNSLKRGRSGRLRTGVDYPRSPFKEEVMGSNPIRLLNSFENSRVFIVERRPEMLGIHLGIHFQPVAEIEAAQRPFGSAYK